MRVRVRVEGDGEGEGLGADLEHLVAGVHRPMDELGLGDLLVPLASRQRAEEMDVGQARLGCAAHALLGVRVSFRGGGRGRSRG